MVKCTGGIGLVGAGPPVRASCASSAAPVDTRICGVNATPVVAPLGHGDVGETADPLTCAACAMVICEETAAPGLATPLCGVSVTATSRSIAGTGADGPARNTESTNCWGVTAPTAGGITGAATTGAAAAGAAGGVAMMVRSSWRRAAVVTWSFNSRCQAFDCSTAVLSSVVSVADAVCTADRSALYVAVAVTGTVNGKNAARSRCRPGEASGFKDSGPI